MLEPRGSSDGRSPERLRAHYEIERRLADRLRSAGKDERRVLYSALYDELFRSVPDHPQLTARIEGKVASKNRAESVMGQLRLLHPFLARSSVFLELGSGDCALTVEVAKRVTTAYGLDVSAEIAKADAPPANFALLLTDGSNIPLPSESVDVAYSNQLMEHLHPDDALDQLREIFRVLRTGGVYVFLTPNRLTGPHDISRYFDDVARGFHLREYAASDLLALLTDAGFTDVTVLVGKGNRTLRVPAKGFSILERLLTTLPPKIRRAIAHNPVVTGVFGLKIVAKKPAFVRPANSARN